jgi:hypothetical protein
LPTGRNWTASIIGGNRASSRTAWINLSVPEGSYEFSIAPEAGYSTNYTGQFAVFGEPATVMIAFSNATYPVVFTEVNLPVGTHWTVNATEEVTDATTTGSSSGGTITLRLLNGTYRLTATDSIAFSGSFSVTTLTVHGSAPTSVTVTFQPIPCGCAEVTAGGSNIPLYLLLGLGVIVVATVAVALVIRSRKPPRDSA